MIRLIRALLIEQNDEWLLTRGYLSKESIGLVLEDQAKASESEVAALERLRKCRRVRCWPPVSASDAAGPSSYHRAPGIAYKFEGESG